MFKEYYMCTNERPVYYAACKDEHRPLTPVQLETRFGGNELLGISIGRGFGVLKGLH